MGYARSVTPPGELANAKRFSC